MTNPGRKRRKRKTVLGVFFRLFFVLLLLSMLAAYISNQVAISSKRAELQTLQEQISQQQTVWRTATYSSSVVGDIGNGNWQSGVMPLNRHAQ